MGNSWSGVRELEAMGEGTWLGRTEGESGKRSSARPAADILSVLGVGVILVNRG